ncbi:MAG: hypothetical protein MZW92_34730 [Comamonadaceae bacterium]|nr:hypothetical protein [Comamonadaceae bacterium]
MLERVWLLLRRVQQLGVREIRGDIVLDGSAFAVPDDARRPTSTASRCGPTTCSPAALLLNYRSVIYSFVPDAARRRGARGRPSRRWPARRSTRSVPLAAGPCGDWRGALKASFEPGAHALRRQLPGGLRRAGLAGGRPAAGQPTTRACSRRCGARWAAGCSGRVRDGAAPADARAELRAGARRRWPKWCATSTSSATT